MINPFSTPFAPPENLVPAVASLGQAHEAQLRVPEEVDIPLPKGTVEEIAVPASINGRDLSQGQP